MNTAASRPMRLAASLLIGAVFVSALALTLFLASAPAAYATGGGGPRYVATTGADGGACTNVAAPCRTIAFAVGVALTGDPINIAAGTYAEHVIVGSKALTFSGAGADSTFVDGSNTGRVFSVTATSATFANLTIQNGYVIIESGGGLYVSGTLTLTNVNVLSNTVAAASGDYDGGGVRVLGELRVTGGRFENNRAPAASGEGGAIRSNAITGSQPNVTISGTTFISNTAYAGGGITLEANVWLTNTQFISNSATYRGGGVFSNPATPGTMTLSGGRFERNIATISYGGGVSFAGAAMVNGTQFISNTSGGTGGGARIYGVATLTDAEFTGNRATNGSGGGLYAGAGLTVTNGTFTGNSSSSTGGGLYAASTATVAGTDFISNTATSGGGLYASSTAALTDTQFTGNSTTGTGGGLYVASTATVTGTQFISNAAIGSGGGLYANSSSAVVSVTGAEFIGNKAGGALIFSSASRDLAIPAEQVAQAKIMTAGSSGGGLYAAGPVTLVDTRVMSNTSSLNGGGLYAGRAATLTGAQFTSNTALSGAGGGLYASYPVTLTNTLFIDNAATNGGGLYGSGIGAGNSRVVNSVFGGNSATTNGAALYLTANSTGRTAAILHTTIGSPSLGAGQAIYVGGTSGVTTDITNTLIASYTVGIQQVAGTVTTWNTLFNGNTANTSGTVNENASVTGDPLFVDPANGDYHLGADSAAVDAGVAAGITTDYDGDSRPQGPGYDIGYDEVLQQCGLSTGVNYTFGSPAVTLNFSNLGDISCAAGVYFPRAQAHATGVVGHGVGADHFWQIAARDAAGSAATGFAATMTAPTGGLAEPQLCFYSGTLGGWDCGGSDNGDGTISRTITHFSDWAVGNDAPLAVPLEVLQGTATPAGAVIAWETTNELAALGYFVQRAAGPGGTWVRLNAQMIASQAPGSSAGYSYRWTDATARRGAAYWYRVSAVDLAGVETPLAAVSVQMPTTWLWLPAVIQ
ncbi:MAG: hypothetical protein NT169_29070 [Chloroflexi bacterium]|nr:hypothetical protein [Chloroflexota bacterium]